MAYTIDTRNAGGQLIVLGDSIGIPVSNASSVVATEPALMGSIRYNPDNNCLEYLSNIGLSWMSLAGVNTAGFISDGELANYLQKNGDVMLGPLAISTLGNGNAAVFTGGNGVLTVSSQGAIVMPSGATSGRPVANTTEGGMRYNTDLNDMEFTDGNQWWPVLHTITSLSNSTVSNAIAALQINSSQIANYTVQAQNIANSTITSQQIAPSTITQFQLAANSVTATQIVNSTVTNVKLASAPTNTLKGYLGSGTGPVTDLTAAQVNTMLPTFVGDSGTGGIKGLVPAPASGDTTAAKFLSASGIWAVPQAGQFVGNAATWEGTMGPFKIQGGHYAGGQAAPTIFFPLQFPTACLYVGITAYGSNDSTAQSTQSIHHVNLQNQPTVSSFTVWCSAEDATQGVFVPSATTIFDWYAIGV